MLLMVPVSLAAGFILASAGRTIGADIDAVRVESLARVLSPTPVPGGGAASEEASTDAGTEARATS